MRLFQDKSIKQRQHVTWVWRKRGSGSPESLCEFASFAPVRAAVEAPPAAKPQIVSGYGGKCPVPK